MVYQLRKCGRCRRHADRHLLVPHRRGILVVNTPDGTVGPVSDHTCALILSTLRQVRATVQHRRVYGTMGGGTQLHSCAWVAPTVPRLPLWHDTAHVEHAA